MPYIHQITTQAAPYAYKQEELLGFCSEMMEVNNDRKYRLLFSQVKKSTGIGNRHLVLSPETMASGILKTISTAERQKIYEDASKELIHRLSKKFELDSEINNIVTVSCTGYQTPGLDFDLIQTFNLSGNLFRYNIGAMGCYAGITGLRLANNLQGNTLLLCLELCSIHFQDDLNFSFVTSNSLFADGAVLLKVGDLPSNKKQSLQILDFRSDHIPNSLDKMGWKLRDKGFEMSLSPDVPDLIYQNIKSVLLPWLGSLGLSVEDITDWVIHPGGLSILHAVKRALNLSDQDLVPSIKILNNYGNMSSGTVFFILESILEKENKINHNSKIVMMAFGPGLSVELALLSVKPKIIREDK
ncbi:MAG: type III polyketide synthase [Candidatus Caenarcaniphilales bacterium]|nr:type III polyketide synthase [Candidatus Caenarcaniphilales bacterium]